jgi:polyisoprenoid-binding protein YceI
MQIPLFSTTFAALYGIFIYLGLAAGHALAADQAAADPGAPAGQYRIDPNHSSLSFSVNHLGLSNYVVRFTSYKVLLQYDPAQPQKSSVTATIDPVSIRTDYPADYKASHADSKFASWDEELAHSDKFFNAGKFPEIIFRSTQVRASRPGALQIVGDLTLLGQTHPVELDATVVGSTANHPMQAGLGAVGFSARGSFMRSTFGMTYLLAPPLISDAVTIQFEGEFNQVKNP